MSASAPATTRDGWEFGKSLVMPILVAVVAAGLSTGGSYWLWGRQEANKVRIDEVTRFIAASSDFDRDFRLFIVELDAKRSAEKERATLSANIQDQYLALQSARTYLDAKDAPRAEAYGHDIVAVNNELQRKLPAPQAHDLIQAVANAERDKVCLTFSLRKSVGMEVLAKDSGDCG